MKILKKSLAFITTISMLTTLSACNSNDKDSSKEETTTEATTEEETTEISIDTYTDSPYNIYAYFKDNLDFIGDYIEYNEETDPNESLGKDGSYIAKLNFEITYVEQSSNVTPDLGASIEIFNNNDDAKARSDYLNGLTLTKDQGNYVCENVVLRITEQAKAKDMSSLNDALLKFMQSPQKYEKSSNTVETEKYELDSEYTLDDIAFNVSEKWKYVESGNNYYWYAEDNSFIYVQKSQGSASESDLSELVRALAMEVDEFTDQETIKINNEHNAIKFNCKTNGMQATICMLIIGNNTYSLCGATNIGNNDTIMKQYVDKIIKSIKINETSSKEELETQIKPDKNNDSVIYEDETVKITYTGIEESYSTDVKLTIENLSEQKIIVQARDVSINGIMANPIFSSNVSAGKKANDSMSFYNLKDDGIDKIETIELSFHIFDEDSWDTIIDTEPITFDVT